MKLNICMTNRELFNIKLLINMLTKTFIIEYSVESPIGVIIVDHLKIKAKNRANEFEAKVKLEEFLKKKHRHLFGRLIIHSCKPDAFGDLFGGNDIFKGFGGFNF